MLMWYLVFLQWLETVVMSWLIRIYSGGFSKTVALSDEVRNAINKFKQKLSHFLYETYTRIRIDHLFNIIIGTYVTFIYIYLQKHVFACYTFLQNIPSRNPR